MRQWLFRIMAGLLVLGIILSPSLFLPEVEGMPLGAVVTPNTVLDDFDAIGGFDGNCSLREALYTINTDSDYGGCVSSGTWGKDTVYLLHDIYQLTIPGTGSEDQGVSGDLDIYPYSPGGSPLSQMSPLAGVPDIRIQGSDEGSDINGNSIDRVLQVHSGVSAAITNVFIYNGYPYDTPTPMGGGVCVFGTLTISNSVIYGNTTRVGGDGGAIYNSGTLTLDHVIVRNNWTGNRVSASSSGAGGGIYNGGDLYATDVYITENNTGNNTGTGPTGIAGGLYNLGTATLNRVTVSDNYCGNANAGGGGRGGGIYNGGTLNLNSSTISGNRSGGSGLSGGNFDGGMGGGIFNGYAAAAINLVDTTVAFNSTGNSSGTAYSIGGGIGNAGGSVIMRNTILASNEADYSPECANTIISDGYNLVKDNSGCTITGIPDTIIDQDPMLAPLADVGGTGWMHPLYHGSPAIDAGPNTCIYIDQRHLGRPKDGNGDGSATCDIGAYEAYIWRFLPMILKP